jgi:hypothetical protein
MRTIKNGFLLIKQAKRPYGALAVLYLSFVAAGMIYGSTHPDLQSAIRSSTTSEVKTNFSALSEAYRGGNFITAVVLTFLVNLFLGSMLSITVPSLIVPFSGIALAGLRAFLWGLLFAPQADFDGDSVRRGIFAAILLVLEGNAYVLTMLGTYLHGKSFLFPGASGLAGHRRGYWIGLKFAIQLYPLIVVQLLVAALYEALLILAIPGGV